MNWAGAPPIKAIVFMIAIVLVVVGVIVYAANAHQEASDVHLALPSSESPTSSTAVVPTDGPSKSAPSIPPPSPRLVSIGPAICDPKDYVVTLGRSKPTPAQVRYDLTATYRGKGAYCMLIEYPRITVTAGHKRGPILNPAGGVILGYGQPSPTKLSKAQQAHSSLLVDGKCQQAFPLLKVTMAGLPLTGRLSAWCKLHESPWVTDPDELPATTTPGVATCLPYDFNGPVPVTRTTVRNQVRYSFTVVNKTGKTCVLNEFPHLTALWHNDRHELKVKPKPVGPEIQLASKAKATGYLEVPATCAGVTLGEIRVENLSLLFQGKPFSLQHCSIHESYWALSP